MATPKLRFKEFSSLWKKNKFSECFDFHMTNSYSRAKLSGQGDVMNIHYGDIHTKFSTLFDVAKESVPFITSKTDCLKIKKDQFLRIGDLVIADASEDYEDIGKTLEVINLNGKQVVAGLHTYIARPNETYATGFFGYLMQTEKVRKQIKVLATGISVLGISKTNLNKLDLDLPPLKEQTKIATFLSAVDTKIDELTQKHELLTDYKKGMMQQIFSQKLRFKADDDSDFEDWKEISLIDFLEFNPRPIKKPEDNYHALGVRSHFKGLFNKFSSDPQKNSMDTLYEVKENDIVVNITFAWEGAVAIAESEHSNGLVSHRFPTYICNIDKVNRQFFKYVFTQKRFLSHLQLCSPGGAGRNRVLNKKDFLDISFNAPCLKEQNKIADFLSNIDQKIDNIAEQIDHAKTWKKGLLQQMFV
ncbi:MAG: restriction endonuclease subunit S [Psychrobacter sp.]